MIWSQKENLTDIFGRMMTNCKKGYEEDNIDLFINQNDRIIESSDKGWRVENTRTKLQGRDKSNEELDNTNEMKSKR